VCSRMSQLFQDQPCAGSDACGFLQEMYEKLGDRRHRAWRAIVKYLGTPCSAHFLRTRKTSGRLRAETAPAFAQIVSHEGCP